jgi:hypothetical protein
MSTIERHDNVLSGIEAEIAETEDLLADALDKSGCRLKTGQEAHAHERRVRDIRSALENLWALRHQHVRANVLTG